MGQENQILVKISAFFASKSGIIFVGGFIGVMAAILQHEGNPGNMGFCIACFQRDIAGALGLHSAEVVQYLRPEIMGIVLGAFMASVMFKEFRARTGSAPIIRFILGFFAMIGALVFLGCPWRAFLRLAGGDGNAVLGIAGLVAGIFVGTIFIKSGFNLGRTKKTYPLVGLILPGIMIALLILLIWDPVFGDDTNVIFKSTSGPGSMYAPLALSLGIAIAVGFFAQRSRFCTVGGIRDTIIMKDYHLLLGAIALVVAAFVTNIALSQFNPGFEDQPVAHNDYLWNFMGMLLAGLAFVLAGGCPGRQLILSGEGNADSAIFILGMIAGAAFSHNLRLASSPQGTGDWGPAAVIFGLIVCIVIGFTLREKV
ncbi:MAG: YedE-related selenium metabolism membrane protein [Methanomassiliicoccales archaeon]|nr:MAG: YedE-related selenium metabolism membrane protein [Methanomassiliicoccales archaeon]